MWDGWPVKNHPFHLHSNTTYNDIQCHTTSCNTFLTWQVVFYVEPAIEWEQGIWPWAPVAWRTHPQHWNIHLYLCLHGMPLLAATCHPGVCDCNWKWCFLRLQLFAKLDYPEVCESNWSSCFFLLQLFILWQVWPSPTLWLKLGSLLSLAAARWQVWRSQSLCGRWEKTSWMVAALWPIARIQIFFPVPSRLNDVADENAAAEDWISHATQVRSAALRVIRWLQPPLTSSIYLAYLAYTQVKLELSDIICTNLAFTCIYMHLRFGAPCCMLCCFN